jgi:hypothetical protein
MQGLGRGIDALFAFVGITLVIFVPLGMWKLIELIIALFRHIHWS